MFLNVSKQTFHISHVRVSRKVKGVLMGNFQHIFIGRQRYWQILKSALVYLYFLMPSLSKRSFFNLYSIWKIRNSCWPNQIFVGKDYMSILFRSCTHSMKFCDLHLKQKQIGKKPFLTYNLNKKMMKQETNNWRDLFELIFVADFRGARSLQLVIIYLVITFITFQSRWWNMTLNEKSYIR